jgi:hypothetical protein
VVIKNPFLSDHGRGRMLAQESCAGIFKQSMGARNRVGIGLSYRPTRLHRHAELIPWNRFLGSLKIRALDAGGGGAGA